MIRKLISNGWKFAKFVECWEFPTQSADKYEDVNLPHDYQISAPREREMQSGYNSGCFPHARGRYVKHIFVDKPCHRILDIDGAYMYTQVFFNENHMATHPNGYTPMLVDLTPYTVCGMHNKLVITTTPVRDSSRWYTGNGVYRDVYLWEGGNIRIEPWDMFVSTVSADENLANIRLKFTVSADYNADITARFTLFAPDKREILAEELSLCVTGNAKTDAEHTLTVSRPSLWDTETPSIYTLKTEIFESGTLLDTTLTDFGIRTVVADKDRGLLLNGKPIKLRGGCIHQDHGALGAVALPAAEERKVRKLKEAGFNALRMAHNPPSLAFLEACDRLGMIVMEEIFDVWNKPKLANDYHLFFEDWAVRDAKWTVLRDRNHPCIFSYSIGNEIKEIDGTRGAAEWSKLLTETVKSVDDTRMVTSGIIRLVTVLPSDAIDPPDYADYIKKKHTPQNVEQASKIAEAYESPLDVPGYNYYHPNHEAERALHPDKPMWASETYTLPFYDQWQEVMRNDYLMGDFCWTAIDNIGEAGAGRGEWESEGAHGGFLAPYPWRLCYQGALDLCAYRMPRSYFKEAVWLGNIPPRIFVTHPEHFGEFFKGSDWRWWDVNESWTYDDKYIGKPIKVETYTDAEQIDWYVNGKKVGKSVPEKAIASLDTVYEKGEITAVAYKSGVEVSRYTLRTSGAAYAISVCPENAEFAADGRDLCYFDISITDSDGNIIADAEREISCTVTGGKLLAVFSGHPCNEDDYSSNRCHTFKGRALAVVSSKNAGEVSINVCSDSLVAGIAKAVAK